MENDENEYSFLNMVLKDFLSNFCHCCIENICNDALKSIYKLKIEPEKMASCYLMFLREKILNTEIECKFKQIGCKERIMFGELRHHLIECRYNPDKPDEVNVDDITDVDANILNTDNTDIKYSSIHNTKNCGITHELSYNYDLSICSSSQSIITSTKKLNKKKRNKKH